MMTHLRIVGRKQNCVSAPISVDHLTSFCFSAFVSRFSSEKLSLSVPLSPHDFDSFTSTCPTSDELTLLSGRRAGCVRLFEQLMDWLAG